MRKIFISKSVDDVSELAAYCRTKNLSLTARSLISFEPIEYEVQNPFDIIFFSSPRSVMFYLRRNSINPETTVAAVGHRTTELLTSLEYKPAFTGEGSDPNKIAEVFIDFVGKRRVLFPVSDNSLGTISSVIPTDQSEVVEVYKTIFNATEISEQDIYVFSSPSNFISYCSKNTLPKGSTVIAWGRSTRKAIENNGLKPIELKEPSIQGVIHALSTLIS